MRILFTILLFLGVLMHSSAYTGKAEALLRQYQEEKKPENKLKFILLFCEQYRTYPFDTLRKYADVARKIAIFQNNKSATAEALYYLGMYHYRVSKLDSAEMMYQAGLKQLKNSKADHKIKLKLELLKSSIYVKKGNHDEALQTYFDVKAHLDPERDTLLYATTLNGIGWVNLELRRYDEAQRWLKESVKISNSAQMEEFSIIPLMNLSITYGFLNQLDSAKSYILKAVSLAQKYENLLPEANGFNILSDIYIAQNEIDKAIKSTKKSIEIRKQIGDPFYLMSDMAQLSNIFFTAGRYDEGIKIANEALEIAAMNNLSSKISLIYNSLYKNLYAKKEYKKSADVLIKLMEINDSLNNKASANKIAEMEAKYNLKQKEQTIKKQTNEIKGKNMIIWFILISLLGILITAFFLYRLIKYREKARFVSLELKQQEALTKSILETEEKEKTKISASLHDGLGQLLSVIKMNLQYMQSKVISHDEKVVSTYYKTLDLVDESVKEVRSVSHELMPSSVIRKGLTVSLTEIVNKIDNDSLQVNLSVERITSELDSNVQLVVYRIMQECINNVIKHAKATKLDISLIQEDDFLHGTIEDNGIGFNSESKNLHTGIGLENIRTRILYLKGELDISSRENEGTVIVFHVPLKE